MKRRCQSSEEGQVNLLLDQDEDSSMESVADVVVCIVRKLEFKLTKLSGEGELMPIIMTDSHTGRYTTCHRCNRPASNDVALLCLNEGQSGTYLTSGLLISHRCSILHSDSTIR